MFFINLKRAMPADIIFGKEERTAADKHNKEEECRIKASKKAQKFDNNPVNPVEKVEKLIKKEDGASF